MSGPPVSVPRAGARPWECWQLVPLPGGGLAIRVTPWSMPISISVAEARALRVALHRHLAGRPTESDLWTDDRPDDDDDPGDCPTCGGHGGGPDLALRCQGCRGTGRADEPPGWIPGADLYDMEKP